MLVCELERGGLVRKGKSDSPASPRVYMISPTTATQHLLLDLSPASGYTLTIRDTVTGAQTQSQVTSTNNGSIRFGAPAGSQAITVAASVGEASAPSIQSVSPNSATAGGPAVT